jgi:hypothetical protein
MNTTNVDELLDSFEEDSTDSPEKITQFKDTSVEGLDDERYPKFADFVGYVNQQFEDYQTPSSEQNPIIKGDLVKNSIRLPSHAAGIDAIKLHVTSYELNPKKLTNDYGILSDNIQLNETSDRDLHPKFSLKWTPPPVDSVSWMKAWGRQGTKPGLTLIFNVSKALKGNNLTETRSPQDFIRAIQSVENGILSQCGIRANLLGAHITGIEITKTEKMPRYVSSYTPVLSRLTHKRMHRKTYQNGNVALKNGQHSITFYDKDLKHSEDDNPGYRLRIEYKINESKQVQKIFDTSNPTPVKIARSWDEYINQTFQTIMNTTLSQTTTTHAEASDDAVSGFEAAYEAAKEDGQTAPYKKALMAYAVYQLEGDERDAILDFLGQREGSQQKYYFKGEIEKVKPYADAFREVSHGTLLDEIEKAFMQKNDA